MNKMKQHKGNIDKKSKQIYLLHKVRFVRKRISYCMQTKRKNMNIKETKKGREC